MTPAPGTGRSLYESIGGDATVAAVVDELYVRLQADPLVEHFFEPVRLPSLKAGQRRWFRAVLGGGEDQPRPDLARAHAELDITDQQVAAVLGHLEACLADAGVRDQDRRRVMAVVGRLWHARTF